MPDPRASHPEGQAAIQPAKKARQHPAVAIVVAAVLAVVVALGACGGPASVPGPTRYRRAVTPAAYSHYIRGRLASYEHDYATAVREFTLARQAAPDEPELTVALFGAILLHLGAR